MGADLKYDLTTMTQQKNNVEQLISTLDTAKTTMMNGLAQIRQDWTLDGGVAFFNSIDQDWVKSVENCIHVLEDLRDALKDAAPKYEEINNNAGNYLKF